MWQIYLTRHFAIPNSNSAIISYYHCSSFTTAHNGYFVIVTTEKHTSFSSHSGVGAKIPPSHKNYGFSSLLRKVVRVFYDPRSPICLRQQNCVFPKVSVDCHHLYGIFHWSIHVSSNVRGLERTGNTYYSVHHEVHMIVWLITQPVVTTIRTTSLPITELEFPAVTICNQGFDMNSMHKVAGLVSEIWDPWYKK